jgi:predicted DsbA family dithiol-disulfide isomerase
MDELEEGADCGVNCCTPALAANPATIAAAAVGPVLDISIVSDAICPWCYVGKRRFEKALALLGPDFRARVTWRPFELNPDMPKEGIPRNEYRMRKFGSLEYSQQLDAQVAAGGAQEGIEFRHDRMLRTPNSFNAHRLIWLAGREGVQYALVEILFRAYFTDGRDVGDFDTLAELAAEAGMDPARVRTFLEGQEGADDVRRDEAVAQPAGISGVPAFIANGYLLFSGAQRPDAIAQVLRKVAEMAKQPATV